MLGGSYLANRLSIGLGQCQVETGKNVSGLAYGFEAVDIKQVAKNGQLVTGEPAGGTGNGGFTIARGPEQSQDLPKVLATALSSDSADLYAATGGFARAVSPARAAAGVG
ncbi:hypothetical protein ABZ924_36245 [Streptomyces sp. NPDC046876]|uniref:hypothetical protein n=1 Tax=Streptomyces sp. NPDC046876 TaxID=3155616 RepID=UPI0033C82CC2